LKYTLLVTGWCNLACSYRYIGKHLSRMPASTARKVIDFAFARTPPDERIEIGFFGGEPLLELDLIREITEIVERHPAFDPDRVTLTVVSNGTIFSSEIAVFLSHHGIALGISCDGPPPVHDLHRRFRNGRGSARQVERNLRRAVEAVPGVMVNAVSTPETLRCLPESVAYLLSLGVRQVYLSPDFSADWRPTDVAALPAAYGGVGEVFADHYLRGDPRFVSLVDGKIAVILRQGYRPLERCRMGRGEFAFTPAGDVYQCERLVGDGGEEHRIGSVDEGLRIERLLRHCASGDDANRECAACSLRDYCMNWCGCSNYFASGQYDRSQRLREATVVVDRREAGRNLGALPRRRRGVRPQSEARPHRPEAPRRRRPDSHLPDGGAGWG